MQKHLLQDMIRVKNISNETKKSQENIFLEKNLIRESFKKNNTYNIIENNNPKKMRHTLWFVVCISLIFFFFSLSSLFLSAIITVDPKIQNLSLNKNLFAIKDSNDSLSFNLLVDNIYGEESKIIKATTEKDILNKATGVVVIFNSFSSSTQKLLIDTRLEGSNGKIYKTEKEVIVPGMKGNIPGSIEVNIYATEAGEEYNSGPLDFSILGFKGSPKYSKFKVRTKTGTKITGGFVGKMNVISDSDKELALTDLKRSLKVKLLDKANNQVPPGFILFKDSIFLRIEDPIILSKEDQSSEIILKGTLSGFVFNEKKLTQKIVQDNINEFESKDVYISNIKDLNFSTSKQEEIFLNDVQRIDFNLSGNAKIVWKVDTDKLINDLLGKPKKNFNEILSKYSNIDSADLKISPFWGSSIPKKSKNIEILVNYPK